MQLSLLKSLRLSSLALLLVACSPTFSRLKVGEKTGEKVVTINEVNPSVQDSSLLFTASIKLYTKYYSGLIFLKQTDSVTSHLVFVTELGMKMFDYQIQNNQFKLDYVFEPLNQPRILNLLESDFKLILLQGLLNQEAEIFEKNGRIYKINKSYYQVNSKSKNIEKIRVKNGLFSGIKVKFTNSDSLAAENIQLKHKGFINLSIQLTKIKQQKNEQ